MAETVAATNFHLPGQVGEVYRGKVGDVYTIQHDGGELLAIVRTDRISAYDAELPKLIPHKGQVLNQISAELLAATGDIAPNWLLDSPDPNATVGNYATPFKIEMIMRGYLLGTAWRKYNEEGIRQICDNPLPDNMREFQPFDAPLLTPTTKASKGDHDVDITRDEILREGLATDEEYMLMSEMAFDLFALGQEMAEEQGLILADTKYEIGRLVSGALVIIDEVHTPDSSRYFPKDEMEAYLNGETDQRPEQLSKEFVREWLAAQGFMNQPGQTMPDIPDEFVAEVSAKYIDLFERMLGRPFQPADDTNPLERIEANLTHYLGQLPTA